MTLGFENLSEFISARARTAPERLAIIDADGDNNMTYIDLYRYVESVDRSLNDRQGDRIGVMMPGCAAFAGVFFGVLHSGNVAVLLDPNETIDEISIKLDHADVDEVICDSTSVEKLNETESVDVIDVEDMTWGVSGSTGTHSTAADDCDRNASSEELVVFTSGSSGSPKGVRLTSENLIANALASGFRLGIEPNDRWLSPLPPCHLGGLSPIVRSTVYGTTAVVQSEFDPERTIDRIVDLEITCISLVPTMLERMLSAGWTGTDSLRVVLLGGARTPTDTIEQALDRNLPIHPTYGMTETASQISTATPTDPTITDGSVGRPLPGVDVRIIDERGQPQPAGSVGEIVVDGPTVASSYLSQDASEDAFGAHGFVTGDIGYFSEGGYLWIVGRRDDRIISGGKTIDPIEVRDVIIEHREIDDVVVYGREDPEWGERVVAICVSTTPEEPPDPADIKEFCSSKLAHFKIPKTVDFIDSIPRTVSGTVDVEAIRSRHH